jgi:Icc protein
VRLVQFTDTHLMADPAATLRGARTLPRLQACIEHARRFFFPADAVVVTGDVVQDEPEAYGAAELLLGDLGAPVMLIPGNHDLPDEMRRRFADPPFQVGGEFRTDNGWQVLLLESWFAESSNGEGRLGQQQISTVDSVLTDARDPHALVFLHHPPLPMDAAALDDLGLLDADELCAVLARHPRVRAVCWGHAHQGLDV